MSKLITKNLQLQDFGCFGKIEVKHLIIYSVDKYIIFIDKDNHLDCKTTNDFDSIFSDSDFRNNYYPIKSMIDRLESTPCNHLSDKEQVSFKRLIGESLANLFESQFDVAEEMFYFAQDWFNAKYNEYSNLEYFKWFSSINSIYILIIFLFLKIFSEHLLVETILALSFFNILANSFVVNKYNNN
jgi:hypothetical protein